MPCSGGPPTDADNAREYRKERDEVTRLLCAVMAQNEDKNSLTDDQRAALRELFPWWNNHKREDARRIERAALERKRDEEQQRLRASARGKLTDDEWNATHR